jgi:hypothetical protein
MLYYSHGISMKIKLSLLLVALCAVFAVSCSESTAPEYKAEKMSITQLNETLGYEWFKAEVAVYTPDAGKVQRIDEAYDPETTSFYLFVNPSCSCKGTQKLFPHTVRILQDAGVTESHMEIYSMRSTSDEHPYMDLLQVHRLPTIFVVKNGVVVGSYSEQASGQEVEDILLSALTSR